MTCTAHLAEELRARGFRITPQRRAILAFLHDTPGHFSPAEIFEHVRRIVPGVTETTVYRTLEFLSVNDMVCSSQLLDGHLVYEDAVRHRHHHLICRDCGIEVSLENEITKELTRKLEQITGFEIQSNHLTFFGLCPACRKFAHSPMKNSKKKQP